MILYYIIIYINPDAKNMSHDQVRPIQTMFEYVADNVTCSNLGKPQKSYFLVARPLRGGKIREKKFGH